MTVDMLNARVARVVEQDCFSDISPKTDEAWMKGIEAIYARMRERAADGPYDVQCAGLTLEVHPEVYAPAFFTDTEWFMTEVASVVGASAVLEIGTGTGAIAIACALQGASVTVTDINPAAVENAKRNFLLHGVDGEVHCGDMYAPIPVGKKFDYIFWAHPFNNAAHPITDSLMMSGFDYRYRAVGKYIAEAGRFLTPNGKLLLGTGSSADLGAIEDIIAPLGLVSDILESEVLPLDVAGGPTLRYYLLSFRPLVQT